MAGLMKYVLGMKKSILTEIEYKILCLMIQSPQKIFSNFKIFMKVCGESLLFIPSKYSNGAYPKASYKNRSKSEKPQIIQTVWGKGYRFGRIC